MLSLHARIALIALLPLLIWGAYRIGAQKRLDGSLTPIEIGIEHTSPATITITRSSGGTIHLVDVANESAETIGISLPEAWVRGEVRRVPLASLTSNDPSFGFRRWQFPPRAIVSFDAVHPWNHVIVHNPSEVPLKIDVVSIDVVRSQTTTESYLVTDTELDLTF
jgi:hypothetical protein